MSKVVKDLLRNAELAATQVHREERLGRILCWFGLHSYSAWTLVDAGRQTMMWEGREITVGRYIRQSCHCRRCAKIKLQTICT